jgi:lipopolysaccharide/colanic/teichoic acid biosynthesis glycosyltransferase
MIDWKRAEDIAIMIVGHMVLLPLWIVVWIAIPLAVLIFDGRPLFYSQSRIGKNRRAFVVRKFRTMVVDADSIGPARTATNDQRVTRFGRLLRKTALDELPQVLSIWSGDMSLVGPRAMSGHEHRELEEQVVGFEKRLAVRPGLTGLSQVYNREDDPELKLALDLEYIQNVSPWLDAKLVLLSIRNTVLGSWDSRGAK